MAAETRLVVRDATGDDLPRLQELFAQLSQAGERPAPQTPTVTDAEHAALNLLHQMGPTRCLVIEANGRVEGTLTLYVLPNLSHGGRPIGIIENVVVDERCQGHGFGRRLMQAAEGRLMGAGCYKIGLTSNHRRADAHRFYEHLGYHATHKGFTRYLI